MATAQLTDTSLTDTSLVKALAGLCRAVPPSGPGVCTMCHGCTRPGFATCWSCARVAGQLGWVCPLVVPVSLYVIPGPLHDCLRRYKDAALEASRHRAAICVATLLARFLEDHGDCLRAAAATDWDYLTTVPSSTGRGGTHPLESALGQVPRLALQHRPTLIRGRGLLGHTRASVSGFSTGRTLSGDRVLVIDDTFTSGAGAQSAAAALHQAGAHVVAVVPVGRVINPGHGVRVSTYWAARSAQPFEVGRCCLENGPVLSAG